MVDPHTLAIIVVMALATVLCRVGGYFLFKQITPTPFIRRVLGFIPGTLFVSFVTPAVLSGGWQAVAGAAATAAVMRGTGNMVASILAGTGAAWLVWLLA